MKKMLLTLLTFTISASIAFAGKGHHLTYKMYSASSDASISGNMDVYFNEIGDLRSTIAMKLPEMPSGGINMTTLVNAAAPDKVYMIDDANKSYTLINISPSQQHEQLKFETKVIGKETVNGYTATHVQMIQDKHVTDMWLSNDVPGYTVAVNMKGSKYLDNERFMNELKAKGIEGVPVRVKGEQDGHSFQMDLTGSKTEDLASSFFQIPAGYTASEGPDNIMKQMGLPSVQEMMNMTPEEREKMAEEIKKKYGK